MKKLHYAWVIAFTGALVTILAHGFGRMSYSVILPSMKDGLALNYTQLGSIATGNFIGVSLPRHHWRFFCSPFRGKKSCLYISSFNGCKPFSHRVYKFFHLRILYEVHHRNRKWSELCPHYGSPCCLVCCEKKRPCNGHRFCWHWNRALFFRDRAPAYYVSLRQGRMEICVVLAGHYCLYSCIRLLCAFKK